MSTILLGCLLAACNEDAPAAASDEADGDPPSAEYGRLMALPLQLRMAETMRGLRDLDSARLSASQTYTRRCMLERFTSYPSAGPSAREAPASDWVAELVAAFRHYWTRSLLEASGEEAARSALLHDIRNLVPGAAELQAPTLDEMEPHVLKQLSEAGLYAQMGVTLPLRDLLLWGRQESRRERVQLPSGVEDVTVELMSDFRSRGWAHYATCGRSSAGGWVGPDRLFAVAESYDLDSEQYRVSYLAHEAQHFRDRRMIEGISPWRLEYRAKLVELILADDTRDVLLRNFLANRSSDKSLAHSYANDLVVRGLGDRLLPPPDAGIAERLMDVPADSIAASARRLLQEDSESLSETGPGLSGIEAPGP